MYTVCFTQVVVVNGHLHPTWPSALDSVNGHFHPTRHLKDEFEDGHFHPGGVFALCWIKSEKRPL